MTWPMCGWVCTDMGMGELDGWMWMGILTDGCVGWVYVCV